MITKKQNLIDVDEVEDYLQYTRLLRELQVRLTIMKEERERALDESKRIVTIANYLKLLKDKHKFKDEKEISQMIRRYAK
jgi:hypothetical protein